MLNLTESTAWDFSLLCLCIWREARGEPLATKECVAWVIKNRVQHPAWWGHTWAGVILMQWQFSSFNPGDPNAAKFPFTGDPAWQDSITAAANVYGNTRPDPTEGSTSYFDESLDANPPKWATDGSNEHVMDSGRLRFWRLASADPTTTLPSAGSGAVGGS